MMNFDYYAITDRGKVREENEDSVLLEYGDDKLIAIVADGMGGYNGGKIASNMAAENVLNGIKALSNISAARIAELLEAASADIYEYSKKNSDLAGMGTTMIAAVIRDGGFCAAHVGDSRMYLLSEGKLRQITRDHSYIQYLVDKGVLTREEAETHPYKNMITRALGMEHVEADFFEEKFSVGDSLLICSDGLTRQVSDTQIKNCMAGGGSAKEKAEFLMSLALEYGGYDNITLAIVQKTGGDSHE